MPLFPFTASYRNGTPCVNGNGADSIPGWMRAVRSVGMVVLVAAVGYLCARYGVQLLQGLLG